MPFADEMINQGTAERLAKAIETVAPGASLDQLREASGSLAQLALRERVDALRAGLLAAVDGGYFELAAVVRAARAAAPDFSGWIIWPVTSAVAASAVAEASDAAFDDAMDLLAELTGLLTSEFAIRTLLQHDTDRALARIATWTDSDDEHIRRLASEGTRPYLPWGVRVGELTRHPGRTLPILGALYRDPSEYVRRSVANHLNDLSREQPELVVQTAAGWLTDPDEHTKWVVRHGLRTLVKRGDPGALALLGFSAPDALEIDGPHVDRDTVAVGEAIELHATIRNGGTETARLAIDYIVHHRKATGAQTPKVFKLSTVTLEPGEEISVRRSHSFRLITTRRYYPGLHEISLQISGVETGRAQFQLTTGASEGRAERRPQEDRVVP